MTTLPAMPATILIIDDHALFRSGVAAMLATASLHADIRESETLDDACAAQRAAPAIILLDIQLRGENGLEGIGRLRDAWPDARIVVVSGLDGGDLAHQAIQRGATTFLSKTERPDRMIALLRALLDDGIADSAAGRTHREPATSPQLTPRQREVLHLLSQGLSNKAIGRRLGVSEHTIRGHVQATLAALEVSSRSEATFVARRLGLLS